MKIYFKRGMIRLCDIKNTFNENTNYFFYLDNALLNCETEDEYKHSVEYIYENHWLKSEDTDLQSQLEDYSKVQIQNFLKKKMVKLLMILIIY